MKKSIISRALVMLLVICMIGAMAMPAFAAEIADATIDMDKKTSLTIYKYDFTNAAKDGIWTESSYVSTGQKDDNVNTILGAATRKGATSSSSALGNGTDTSNGYAIKGVEYTYLKVADIVQYSESEADATTFAHVEVLYKFNKTLSAGLLKAIGLDGGLLSYAPANALDNTSWFYQSNVLNKALADSLAANATTVKNALEAYVKTTGGVAMPLTDADGKSEAKELDIGLYLLVETKVPEMVTTTTDPFFVSLPMTSVDGGGDGQNGNTGSVTTGGHDWLYDVTIYPKNQTGIVDLEKTVREAKADTGKNNGELFNITDGYAHTATASAGDVVEFQIISTLPTITSTATSIAEYTFQDILSRGMSYNINTLKIEFFKSDACKETDLITTWTASSGKFNVNTTPNADESTTMTITMSDTGLAEINTANVNAGNVNGSLYAGYSNYTMRVSYTATLHSDESLVYGDEGNCNEVVLTWRRSSSNYYDTLVDDAHVFTYGINLTKTFADGKDDQALFDHVKFKFQNKTDGYYVQAALNAGEGIWYVTGHTDKEEEATAIYPVDWQGKKGQIVLKGTEDDEYILTEIETANGYTLLKENISVVITSTDDATRPCDIYDEDTVGLIQNDARFNFDGGMDLKLANIPQAAMAHNMLTASATVDSNKVTMINDEVDTTSTNAMAPLTVVNTNGFKLPQTGELSLLLMPIIGGTMMLGAVLFLFLLRRKKEDEQAA